MKHAVLFFAVVLAMVSLFMEANAQVPKIGSAVENFTLNDINGKSQSLDSLKGKNGAVVVFLSAQCPVVRGYHERINQIASDYQARGINFIGINSNVSESLEWVRSNAAEYGYKFPVLIDKGNVLADKLGANVTPEVYYLDAKNVLLYHGAIDNDRSGRNISENYLKTAFDASLSGKKIERTSANAFGCSIRRVGDQ
ncbi:MAG TPA: redoxin domain-containing protein [Pyrinomonadaceae bacterium]|nr:redoxin domain-containing protein [Pyrinomonadaceae bacterium]